MKIFAITVLALTGLASTAQAASDCRALMAAYENAGKAMSMANADVAGDDSVYRAILAEMKINNLNLTRQLNLTLMISHKCPLPDTPASNEEYVMNALECKSQQIKGGYKSRECDFSIWKKTEQK